MLNYNFYEIRSRKSQEFVNGVRQVSLVCSDDPEIHCFLWLDQEQELTHLQFLFNERLIEWFANKRGLIVSETNRRSGPTGKIGVMKGVRTIHAVQDNSILQEGLNIIKAADFPKTYKDLIQTKLLS